jgi:hypothetical protein
MRRSSTSWSAPVTRAGWSLDERIEPIKLATGTFYGEKNWISVQFWGTDRCRKQVHPEQQ